LKEHVKCVLTHDLVHFHCVYKKISCYRSQYLFVVSSLSNRESKVQWNIYTEAYFLSMIATVLNIPDLFVQKQNPVSLLGVGGQLPATKAMYVLLQFNLFWVDNFTRFLLTMPFSYLMQAML
jgi:hypothetical protein